MHELDWKPELTPKPEPRREIVRVDYDGSKLTFEYQFTNPFEHFHLDFYSVVLHSLPKGFKVDGIDEFWSSFTSFGPFNPDSRNPLASILGVNAGNIETLCSGLQSLFSAKCLERLQKSVADFKVHNTRKRSASVVGLGAFTNPNDHLPKRPTLVVKKRRNHGGVTKPQPAGDVTSSDPQVNRPLKLH